MGLRSRVLALVVLASAIAPASAGCEGIADLPDDLVICCRTRDQLEALTRITCIYDPEGRVVDYSECAHLDAGPAVEPPMDADGGTLSESR